jgi:glycosyltransferase involved in cell wall biosynthesis
LVSVVTPFYNTAPYLSECIESVLAQTHSDFEYILSDNCSTDGSRQIAEDYARRDSRIRLVVQPKLLPQVPHYNSALAQISDQSRFCKIVQADDWIYPNCLELMLKAFAQSDSIGLVSAYDLKGDLVRGSGFPALITQLDGKEMGRFYLRQGTFVFGSPSTVMYRSSLIRGRPFFEEGRLHEDTEKCMEILRDWDFGFVHQVLSFIRVGNESISAPTRAFLPEILDWYILVRRYGSAFLEPPKSTELEKKVRRSYYRSLAVEAICLRRGAFWRYHSDGLNTINESLDPTFLGWSILRELSWLILNPGQTVSRAFGRLRVRSARSQSLKTQ